MQLQEGDYYFTNEGFLVFTEQYHKRRGYCCNNGCRHCPYRKQNTTKEEQKDFQIKKKTP